MLYEIVIRAIYNQCLILSNKQNSIVLQYDNTIIFKGKCFYIIMENYRQNGQYHNRLSNSPALQGFAESMNYHRKPDQFSLPPLSSKRKDDKNVMKKMEKDLAQIKNKLKRDIEQQNDTPPQTIHPNNNMQYAMPLSSMPYYPYPQPNFQQPQPMPMSMPMPIPIPIPFPMMNYPYGYEQQTPKKKKRKHKKKPKKQVKQQQKPPAIKQKKVFRKDLLKRFRICGYAVYFTIFFKCYSKRFTENRKNWFDDRYNKKNSKIIYRGSEKMLKELYKIDLCQIIKDADKQSKSKEGDEYVDSFTSIPLIPTPETKSFILTLDNLFKNFQQLLQRPDFMDEYHEVFTAGTLNQSFMITNLYLPHQLHFLHVHPQKGYLLLTSHEEIQLLLIRVFIKMLIYNYLLQLKTNQAWISHISKQHGLNESQIWELTEKTRKIGLFIYAVVKEMYFIGVKNVNKKPNFYEYARKFGIKIAKNLEDIGPQQKKKNNHFEIIKRLEGIQNMEESIKKNHPLKEFKEITKGRIVDILANLHAKLKKQEQEVYKYIKNLTLQEPYLIFGTKKKAYQDKKLNQSIIPQNKRQFLLNRYQNESSFSQDQSSLQKYSQQSQIKRNNRKTEVDTSNDKQNQLGSPPKRSNVSYNALDNQNLKDQSSFLNQAHLSQTKYLQNSHISAASSKMTQRYNEAGLSHLKYKLKKIVAKK